MIGAFKRAWNFWWDYKRRCEDYEFRVWAWNHYGCVGPEPTFPPPTVPNIWGEMP